MSTSKGSNKTVKRPPLPDSLTVLNIISLILFIIAGNTLALVIFAVVSLAVGTFIYLKENKKGVFITAVIGSLIAMAFVYSEWLQP